MHYLTVIFFILRTVDTSNLYYVSLQGRSDRNKFQRRGVRRVQRARWKGMWLQYSYSARLCVQYSKGGHHRKVQTKILFWSQGEVVPIALIANVTICQGNEVLHDIMRHRMLSRWYANNKLIWNAYGKGIQNIFSVKSQ